MIRSPIALAFFRTVLLFFALFVLTSGTAWEVRAQPNAFLLTPYYGTHVITNNYSGGHPAYDFDMSHEQVLAAEAGTIERVRWYDNRPECHGPVDNAACGYGFHIYIRHANNYTTRYGHLNATAFDLDNLSYGAPVQRGQIIGMSGNTGWATGATGLHLHFEVKDANGGSVDPFNPNLWMDGQWAGRPIPAPINGGETFTYVSTNNSGGFSKGENNGVTPPPFNNTCTGDCANWTAATSTYGSMYSTLVNGSVPDSWAKWQAAVSPNGGMYEVFVYVPSNNATS
jgi:hypothetical protein